MGMRRILKARVIGHPYADSGMGQHARALALSLASAGVEVELVDVYGHFPPQNQFDESLSNLRQRFDMAEPTSREPDVDIYAINCDEVEAVRGALGVSMLKSPSILFPMWELSRLPEPWHDSLSGFEEIWTASDFTRHPFAKVFPGKVKNLGIACVSERPAFVRRGSMGIPEDAVVVLATAHLASYIARKNPMAALDAVTRVARGPSRARAHLVLNVSGRERHPEAWRRLKSAVGAGSDVTLISSEPSRPEYLGLLRASDVFVSLHRSEGFGLAIAEAMLAGKAVVTTRYSGNLEFCNESNSLLVDYDLGPVNPGEYVFAEGQKWAYPDMEHAVELLASIVEDRGRRHELGRRARQDIRTRWSPAVVGLRYKAALELVLDHQ